MPSSVDKQQRLRFYRPKRLGVRLAAFSSSTYLLSDMEGKAATNVVLEHPVKIFYDPENASMRIDDNPAILIVGLIFALIGLFSLFKAESFSAFIGISLFTGFGMLLFVSSLRFFLDRRFKYSLVLTPESLQLPGTGEFMWTNIKDMAIKERNHNFKVLLIQLSNGTIVEHRVKSCNSDSLGYADFGDTYKLRQLIFTYWANANSLELKPLEAPKVMKQQQT